MCQRVQCSSCGKPTFAGCGAHIEQVLGDVPKADRCTCRETKTTSKAVSQGSSSWLKSLLGK